MKNKKTDHRLWLIPALGVTALILASALALWGKCEPKDLTVETIVHEWSQVIYRGWLQEDRVFSITEIKNRPEIALVGRFVKTNFVTKFQGTPIASRVTEDDLIGITIHTNSQNIMVIGNYDPTY